MMNGVDVADVTWSFSEDDWHKLGDAGQQYVNAERARNRGSGNNDNRNVSDVNAAVLVTMPTMRAMILPLEVQTVIEVPRMGLGLEPMVAVDAADGTLVLLPLVFAVSTESAQLRLRIKLWTDSWAATRWILMRIPVVQVQTGRLLS